MDKSCAVHASILHDTEAYARHAYLGGDRERRSAIFQALRRNADSHWLTELPDDIGHPWNFNRNAVLPRRLVKPSRYATCSGIVKILVAAARFDRDAFDFPRGGDPEGEGRGALGADLESGLGIIVGAAVRDSDRCGTIRHGSMEIGVF